MRLLYFPVSRTTSGAAITTPSPSSAGLVTAVYGNATLTSPSVYISFHTAYAENQCGKQVGERYPGAILTLKADQLSSVYGLDGTMYSQGIDPLDPMSSTPYLIAGSFDLANLNWPVPVSAYENQPKYALGGEIFSIVFNDYNPVLAVPPEIRELDPAWKSCELDWQGLYDPPKALQPASAMAGPTTTANDPVSTTASPSSKPSSPAKQTQSVSIATHVSSVALAPVGQTQASVPTETSAASSTVISHLHSSAVSSADPGGQSVHESAVSLAGAETAQSHDSAEQSEIISTIGFQSASEPAAVTAKIVGQSTYSSPLPPGTPQGPRDPADSTSVAGESVQRSVHTLHSQDSALVVVSAIGQSNNAVGDGTAIAAPTPGVASLRTTSNGLLSAIGAVAESAATDPARTGTDGQSDPEQTPRVIVVGSIKLTEGGAVHTVFGQTLSLGTGVIAAGMTTVSLAVSSQGSDNSHSGNLVATIVAGGMTLSAVAQGDPGKTLDPGEPSATSDPGVSAVEFTFGSHVYTASRLGASRAVIAGHTLSAGGPGVQVSAGSLSLASNDEIVMHWTDPTSTSPANVNSGPTEPASRLEVLLTLPSSTLTAVRSMGASNGIMAVNGVTLSADGSALTVGGETVSALSDGIIVASGDHRETLTFESVTATGVTSRLSVVGSTPSTTSDDSVEQNSATASSPTSTTTSGASRHSFCTVPAVLLVMIMLALVVVQL